MAKRKEKLDALTKAQKRFGFNVKRVRVLLSVFDDLDEAGNENNDVLRAAVVFLHATLEDALRSLTVWKLPNAPKAFLKDISFDQATRSPKISVADLCDHRDKTVEELFCSVIRGHVSRLTFNNVRDVLNALQPLGLKPKDFASKAGALAPLIDRRHKIVHESDRREGDDSDHGRPRSIEKHEVVAWVESVEEFGTTIFTRLKATVT